MVLHNSFLKFDFAYIMVFLWQYSKKNYRKIPKSSKIYIKWKCQILNRLGFNNYWILLHEINFHWRISMSVNTFPLEVFDFGVLLSAILTMSKYNMLKHAKISAKDWHGWCPRIIRTLLQIRVAYDFMYKRNWGKEITVM